jgi:uncharacterized protein
MEPSPPPQPPPDQTPLALRPPQPDAPAQAPPATTVHVMAPPQRCPYCGAPLYGEFYFCLSCATPYKRHDLVLPPVRLAPVPESELIQRKAPHVWPLFWSYMGVVVGAAIVSFFLFGQGQEAFAIILGTAALFVTTSIFGAIHWRSLAVQLKRIGFLNWAAWAALGMLAPLLALNYGYHGALKALGARGGLEVKQLLETGLSWGGILFFLCVCPAVLEELAFRGLVQHWLQVALRPWRAMVLASALFTILHFSVLSAPYLFLVGMLLGWAKWKTGSLYPSMLIHFAHNLVALAVMG